MSSHPGFRIDRNIGGVEGLHVAFDVFSEAMERHLFTTDHLWPPEAAFHPSKRSHAGGQSIYNLPDFPREIFELVNAVRDCELLPNYQTPDYCLCFNYPKGSSFQSHYDSKYRWGEVVLGVNLGASCVLTMTPDDKTKPTVRVNLPRRSIYVMTGESRHLWKHGISKVGIAIKEPIPWWNPGNKRRSFTMRSTKPYAVHELEYQLQKCRDKPEERAAINARLAWLKQWWPPTKDQAKAMNRGELQTAFSWAERYIQNMERYQPHTARMPKEDALFLRHIQSPEIRALYVPGPRAASQYVPQRGAGLPGLDEAAALFEQMAADFMTTQNQQQRRRQQQNHHWAGQPQFARGDANFSTDFGGHGSQLGAAYQQLFNRVDRQGDDDEDLKRAIALSLQQPLETQQQQQQQQQQVVDTKRDRSPSETVTLVAEDDEDEEDQQRAAVTSSQRVRRSKKVNQEKHVEKNAIVVDLTAEDDGYNEDTRVGARKKPPVMFIPSYPVQQQQQQTTPDVMQLDPTCIPGSTANTTARLMDQGYGGRKDEEGGGPKKKQKTQGSTSSALDELRRARLARFGGDE